MGPNVRSTRDFSDGSLSDIALLLQESIQYEEGLTAALKTEMDRVAAGQAPTLTEQNRDDIIDAINEEAEKRKGFYQLIKVARAGQQENESVADAAARQQIELSKYLESNLDAVKAALNAATEEKQKKMKMVEINTYYGKQYQGYGRVARGVTVIAGILFVLYLVKSMYGFDKIIEPSMTLVQWIGGIYMIWTLYDVASRRNDNYDHYIFPMAPRTDTDLNAANAALEKPVFDISGIDIPGLCAGSYCCGPGTTWSDKKGCVTNTNVVGNNSYVPPPDSTSTKTPGSTATQSAQSSTLAPSSTLPSTATKGPYQTNYDDDDY